MGLVVFLSAYLRMYLQAFGAPTIVAHVNGKKELFFGSDRFPQLAALLGEFSAYSVIIYSLKLEHFH